VLCMPRFRFLLLGLVVLLLFCCGVSLGCRRGRVCLCQGVSSYMSRLVSVPCILPRLGGCCRLSSSLWVASSLSATFIVAWFLSVISMVTRSPFLSPIFSFTSRGMYILSLWYLVSFISVSYPIDWVNNMGYCVCSEE